MRLDSIHIILKEYIAEQEKLQCRWPCDAEYNVPTWDNIYDALEAIFVFFILERSISAIASKASSLDSVIFINPPRTRHDKYLYKVHLEMI